METYLKTPGSITLDVETDDTYSLRRRIQARAAEFTASMLPGGAIVEDGPDATTYHFPADSGWTVVMDGGVIRLTLAK